MPRRAEVDEEPDLPPRQSGSRPRWEPARWPLTLGSHVIGPQFASFTLDGITIDYLENVGTFDPANPLEIRQNGITAFGADGFVPPPLLSIRYHAPYLHNGAAQTLDAVFPLHALGAGHDRHTLTAQQQQTCCSSCSASTGVRPPGGPRGMISGMRWAFRNLPVGREARKTPAPQGRRANRVGLQRSTRCYERALTREGRLANTGAHGSMTVLLH